MKWQKREKYTSQGEFARICKFYQYIIFYLFLITIYLLYR